MIEERVLQVLRFIRGHEFAPLAVGPLGCGHFVARRPIFRRAPDRYIALLLRCAIGPAATICEKSAQGNEEPSRRPVRVRPPRPEQRLASPAPADHAKMPR